MFTQVIFLFAMHCITQMGVNTNACRRFATGTRSLMFNHGLAPVAIDCHRFAV